MLHLCQGPVTHSYDTLLRIEGKVKRHNPGYEPMTLLVMVYALQATAAHLNIAFYVKQPFLTGQRYDTEQLLQCPRVHIPLRDRLLLLWYPSLINFVLYVACLTKVSIRGLFVNVCFGSTPLSSFAQYPTTV